ncbi:BlaI/MecI/CopY family transcriptional regulator [Nonlabens sp. Ci31]|jgi:predicted transcriptional regulator|uniref:BlaI/MecI/CopY family transcriptional regulator n=1 Tax=Nonlabens sp. Ci31 TaxID=2608253 RepID=UPI00146297AB|nr:BlaI/MecI/CopY family transcriptional regulator [Nonlabens sp. Ci31]QJP34960.1 BlaI/MecI/CopY family transcriptional regulator [Nonlabens sp. Ci31]
MKTLTTAEEDIMQHLWDLKEANVAQIIDKMPEPKPAYNTVSTIIRILENKDFVNYRKEGRGHIYFPSVSKNDYSQATASKLASNYFKGSFKSMVSFFMQQEDLSVKELEEILNEINKKNS